MGELSLHDRQRLRTEGRGVEFGDAQGREDAGRPAGAAGDRALALAIAEHEVHDSDGAQQLQGFGRGQIQAGRFELLLDRAVEEEGPPDRDILAAGASLGRPAARGRCSPVPSSLE